MLNRTNNHKISVVIPVKNAGNKIYQCLQAVYNQTVEPYEVIIIDGHSKDDTVKIASQFPVKIFFEEFKTVGGARNLGVTEAMGNIIAFTDADCIPNPSWLEGLISELKEGVVGVGGSTKNIGHDIWGNSIALVLDSFFGSANSIQDRLFVHKMDVKSISGCNSLYRKSDLIQVGNFKTTLTMNEDTEINQRLLKIGRIVHTPNALVFHDQDRTIKAFMQRMYSFGRGRGYNRLWDIQVVPPFVALIALISLVFYPILFAIFAVLYFIILILFDVFIFYRIKQLPYIITIPIVFILEHTRYILGFWSGLIEGLGR